MGRALFPVFRLGPVSKSHRTRHTANIAPLEQVYVACGDIRRPIAPKGRLQDRSPPEKACPGPVEEMVASIANLRSG
jgi:hypothetical protein